MGQLHLLASEMSIALLLGESPTQLNSCPQQRGCSLGVILSALWPWSGCLGRAPVEWPGSFSTAGTGIGAWLLRVWGQGDGGAVSPSGDRILVRRWEATSAFFLETRSRVRQSGEAGDCGASGRLGRLRMER